MTAFETISLIVNGALLLATAGATVVAWTLAIAAGRDRHAAEEARDAAVKAQQDAAISLSTANTISLGALEAQRLALPPAWGNPERIAHNSYSIRNTSGRTIVVNGFVPLPGGNVYIFTPPELPARVENGDTIRFTALLSGSTSKSGNSVELRWSYEDEPGLETLTVRRF